MRVMKLDLAGAGGGIAICGDVGRHSEGRSRQNLTDQVQIVILSLEFGVNENFPVIASIITYIFCQIDSCLLEKSRGGGTR